MTTSTIRAALERLIELEDTASANGADPDTTAWDEAVATGRAVLKAEPEGEGPSLADVDELCAEFGFHPDDDQGEGLEILSDMITAAIARWGAPVVKPATPPAPEQPLSSLMAQELAKAEQRHGRFDASETIERLGRCHSAMSARGDVQSAALCQHSATLLQQQTAELAALREELRVERFVAGQNRISQLWVDALDPSTQVPLSAPQIKKLRKVLDDHCDQGPPNGTMWKSQELEELMWAVEGWVGAATPLPAPQAGEGEA